MIVVELASVLAGPAVGMFFAELGAEVIKIENKTTGGDVTRSWRLPTESVEKPYSAYYCSVNWHKNVLFLDLNEENDRQIVLEWIKKADIVVSNFKQSAAQKMKMDYDTLQAINPRLIYAQLTSFGENDDTPAFDVVLQAEAGFLYMTGEAKREPVKMPVALIDILAAHQLKEGILMALWQRERTGKGAFVTTSLLESAIASLANQATNWLMEGFVPQRMGTMHPNIAPYGDMFRTKDDKWLVLAVGTERQFGYLCEILQLPDLLIDNRFSKNQVRVKNRKALKRILAQAIGKWERDLLWHTLRTKGVPAGAIRTMPEVFELPAAQAMVLEEKMNDGSLSKRVKSVAFSIK